eukprot:365134-Chlamydomonas_euryale.AAC.8
MPPSALRPAGCGAPVRWLHVGRGRCQARGQNGALDSPRTAHSAFLDGPDAATTRRHEKSPRRVCVGPATAGAGIGKLSLSLCRIAPRETAARVQAKSARAARAAPPPCRPVDRSARSDDALSRAQEHHPRWQDATSGLRGRCGFFCLCESRSSATMRTGKGIARSSRRGLARSGRGRGTGAEGAGDSGEQLYIPTLCGGDSQLPGARRNATAAAVAAPSAAPHGRATRPGPARRAPLPPGPLEVSERRATVPRGRSDERKPAGDDVDFSSVRPSVRTEALASAPKLCARGPGLRAVSASGPRARAQLLRRGRPGARPACVGAPRRPNPAASRPCGRHASSVRDRGLTLCCRAAH